MRTVEQERFKWMIVEIGKGLKEEGEQRNIKKRLRRAERRHEKGDNERSCDGESCLIKM